MLCGEVTVFSKICKLFGGISSPLLHNRINFQATAGGHTPEVTRLYVDFHKNSQHTSIPKSREVIYALHPTTTHRLRIKRTWKMVVCLWVKFQRSNISETFRAVWDDKMAVTCEPRLVCTDKMATVVSGTIFTSRDEIIEQSIIIMYTADRNRYKINRQSGGKILCLLQCWAKQSWLAAGFVVICRYKICLRFSLAASESPLSNKLLSLNIWYEYTFHVTMKITNKTHYID